MGGKRIFVAGATGVTGRALLRLAAGADDVFAHARPRSAAKLEGLVAPPRLVAFELDDRAALDAALTGVTTVVSLIGTMKTRFSAGDTYQSSDIGTTETLVAAARRAGAGHFVLLSSVGADKPINAYLRAKARAEEIVRGSGLAATLFRPSVLVGEQRGGGLATGAMGAVTRLFGFRRYQPIPVEDLAGAILHAARRGEPLGVVEGATLFALAELARLAASEPRS